MLKRLFNRKANANPQPAQVELTTGLHERDGNFTPAPNLAELYRDRYDYDRQTLLSQCLRAWRVNPLARRVVKIVSMFVVGEGIQIKSDHEATHKFLQSWWEHPLNQIGRRCAAWCDEATRSGNLFFLCTPDQANGMLYVRAVPADQVDEIITAENDVQQELAYKPVKQGAPNWPAYLPLTANDQSPTAAFMLHYAYNQPVGVAWGESDLAPLLPWLNRYTDWLETRASLNRFRSSWIFTWKHNWKSEAEKYAKDLALNANPPSVGSWVLIDPEDELEMPSPHLDGSDAEKDGLALKKMIAIGAGVPVHYLAEPESATRTTAEAAGTPTFRGLEQTQQYFLEILADLARTAVGCRKKFDRRVDPGAKIQALGPDITERDNSLLALAASRIYPAFSELYDREGIEADEFLRVVYRMAGEVPPAEPPANLRRRPLKPISPSPLQPGRSGTAGGRERVKEEEPQE